MTTMNNTRRLNVSAAAFEHGPQRSINITLRPGESFADAMDRGVVEVMDREGWEFAWDITVMAVPDE